MWTGGLFWGVLGRMGRHGIKRNVKTSHRDPPSAAARPTHRSPVTAHTAPRTGAAAAERPA
eukprot:1249172-Prymnesium_polylepis.2